MKLGTVIVFGAMVFFLATSQPYAAGTNRVMPCPICGVTIDDSWEVGAPVQKKIIQGLQAFTHKPMARIVYDKNYKASHYSAMTSAIHAAAYVMASPVDSFYMKSFTRPAYLARFKDYLDTLGNDVDIWEVGNEINGWAWLGKDVPLIVNKMHDAYQEVHNRGKNTALTLYEFKPGDQPVPMLTWAQNNVPADMRSGLNYVLVSYYEDNNEGYQPDWTALFARLQTLFPNAKLGIGECGNTATNATTSSKIAMIHHYYEMPKYVANYVGGYFWWTWVKDAIPYQNNQIWNAMNQAMAKQKY